MQNERPSKRVNDLAKRDVRPSSFVHVVFRTGRFDAMVAFYQLFLNGWEVMSSRMLSFQTYDAEHHRVAIVNAGNIPPLDRRSAGIEHIAYAYSSLGDLFANYLRLKDAGIRPYWCINHGPTTSLYYRDPDGNQIETQTDNFPTAEELLAFFETEAFKSNPIGVEFDPDRLVELYRQGNPEDDLKLQGAAPIAAGTGFIPEI